MSVTVADAGDVDVDAAVVVADVYVDVADVMCDDVAGSVGVADVAG